MAKEEAPMPANSEGGGEKVRPSWWRPTLVLAFALIPGSAGFLGMGHFYLRRLRRGFILFLVGWVLYFLLGNLYIALAAYLVLFAWQAYDAWRISRRPQASGEEGKGGL